MDEFLKARYKAIMWMTEECGSTDSEIALALSMDEQQVYLIRVEDLPFPDLKAKSGSPE
jgi:hypothetical protein